MKTSKATTRAGGKTPDPQSDQQTSLARQGEVLATASRELRTPLAMVLGFAKLLASHDGSTEQVRAMAGEIQRATKGMVKLINDLSDSATPIKPKAPATSPSSELAALRQRLAAAEQRSLALEEALADARLARQQLQSYADDFRRTYSESRQLLQQMTALYQVTTAISATVDPDEVLARTISGLQELLPGAGAAVYLFDDDGRLAHRQAVSFPSDSPPPPESAAPDESPLGRCLAAGEAVLDGPREPADDPTKASWTLVLPLLAGSQRLGALLLARRGDRPLTAEERHLAEMVTSQVAMAVQNARLAATDALTGLYNRRYFERTLAFECDRARRVERPLGLLMVDIDHFKRFNESFGHPAGDAVLQLVATTLAGQLRRTDIVARVGGEEFAAILPENTRPAVAVAAERLRRAVEQHPCLLFDGRELPRVRISVGAASLDPQVATPRALMKAADTALRQAKRRGRNRSVVADVRAGDDCA